ncbi:helix-turn-helix transcriptional regulator [Paenibacillus gansuensis]|uniref:Helix-turn-helix transcriptional regulator n=1 Tax=Paenibacillus gansuensis TaxID=306542 RepID=A0ABW5PH22_9BACL
MTDTSVRKKALEQLIGLFDQSWASVSIYYYGIWRNQGWDGPPDSFEIAYYIQGENTIYQDNEILQVKEGHMLFLPDTIRNSRCEGGTFKAYYLSFVFQGNADLVGKARELYAQIAPESIPLWIPGLESCFSRLLSEFQLQQTGSLLVKHYFLHILVQAYQSLDHLGAAKTSAVQTRHKELTEQVILRLNEEYGDKIRLADLARQYGMNERYLNYVFKSVTGVPLGSYLTGIRIEHAKRLLLTTRRNITEIALETGFYDASHFCKTFKMREGMSPAEYVSKKP